MAFPFPKPFLPGALLAALLSLPALGADVYKASLDAAIPHHAAILDTLAKLEKEPGNAQLHNDLGCLVAWDGFWRDALRSFEKASELDPKDTRPWFNAGLVQGLRGEWSAARSRFHKAVKVDPGNWQAWWMLGFAEESLGHEKAALDAYARSLRVDTSLFDPKVNPFAVGSRLKSRALLETYEKRRVDAAIPFSNQLAQPSRVAGFFQTKAATPAGTVEIQEPPKTGPVVMSAPPPARVGPAAAAPPASDPTTRRRRAYGRQTDDGAPIEVVPAQTRRPPDATDASPGPGFGTGSGAPGTGIVAPTPAPAPGTTPPPRRIGQPGPGGPPAPDEE